MVGKELFGLCYDHYIRPYSVNTILGKTLVLVTNIPINNKLF